MTQGGGGRERERERERERAAARGGGGAERGAEHGELGGGGGGGAREVRAIGLERVAPRALHRRSRRARRGPARRAPPRAVAWRRAVVVSAAR